MALEKDVEELRSASAANEFNKLADLIRPSTDDHFVLNLFPEHAGFGSKASEQDDNTIYIDFGK
jgi:hypothetical protein